MNTEQHGPFAHFASSLGRSSKQPTARRLASVASTVLAWVALLGVGLGAASQAGAAARSSGDDLLQEFAGPGAIFESVEAAALDALAHAHHVTHSRDRGRLRVGTIYRVPSGYRYSEPTRSERTVWSSRSPILRYSLRPVDVASYVIHPRSGSRRLDRANETANEYEQRVVDELDPMGRPLYLLTPSLRVIRYSAGGKASQAALAPAGLAD